MMQNLGNRRSVQKCAQNAGSNVLKQCWVLEGVGCFDYLYNNQDTFLLYAARLYPVQWATPSLCVNVT